MRVPLIGFIAAGLVCASPGAIFAQTAAPAGTTTPAQPLLKPEQLEQILAPIALYQDDVLSQVLIASTYPLEVVQADRWAREHKTLKGDALKTALAGQNWDQSVKALIAVPSVLAMMSERLDWSQKLGDAVLAQQKDVMDAIQRLRAKAQAAKKLASTKEQTVVVKTEQNKQVIVIQSAVPGTIYVPYYNPAVVYGAWAYPAYPPVYYPPPGYVAGTAFATGLAFATGVAVGSAVWGGGFNWNNNDININVNNSNTINKWEHNSAHRRGVQYNNAELRQRYGKADFSQANQRMDFRGRNGEQVLRPDANRRDLSSGPNGSPQAGRNDRPANLNGPNNRDRAASSNRAGGPNAAPNRTADLGGRDQSNAFSGIGNGDGARLSSERGRESLGGGMAGGGRSFGGERPGRGGGGGGGGGMRRGR
ncbi:DUF3300 domain-containing protein [Rhodoplanes sp. Z2-YC6860]|uniref:DUF3300 domain-containing protein n=1 Tax=Rhodoplanes sp. Z2-YC6860 TaxID=674703 RepID=UPI00078D93EF|nr:DUF3300 domain-containing protein [Rhodoplanes sp. Z2-YC6860]AMN43660.1 hypothetical protein RHPLAN_52380 [Rhodoplanes sp. Z2-YC6860]